MDEILNLIESVSEGFPSYFFIMGTIEKRHLLPSHCRYFDQKITEVSCINLYYTCAYLPTANVH